MTTRSRTALATGTASAAKFFVAALAFTAAYAGLSAYGAASSAPVPPPVPAQAVTLSARELPAAVAGEITVGTLDTAPGCLKTFLARTVIVNPDPAATVSYRWRLARWNPGTNSWRTYLVHYSGFAGAEENAVWDPAVSANPGWYRVELKAEGRESVKSDRFQVSC
ncbi:hypothetical protein [Nonomuraea sp. SBT364]|uniref:hypothetical protein n=1 Tax=Nonomuraea sp. SBT364 TaxID=1580530 RepID=UPI000B2EDC86|nr:hypothetical protein [Nonomuraea sp. SBT364]